MAKENVAGKKRLKKVSPKKTYIALVVDRSGSMNSIREEAFTAINEQIEQIKANAHLTGETFVSYVQFDGVVETVFDKRPVSELSKITWDQYTPRGSTAIRDAIGLTVNTLKNGVEETADTAYLVVLISDGEENASREFSPATIKTVMDALRETKKWTFSYMLSGRTVEQMQDFSTQFSVPTANMASFTPDSAGVKNASMRMASSISSYSTLRSSGATSSDNFYNGTGTGVLTVELTGDTSATVKKGTDPLSTP